MSNLFDTQDLDDLAFVRSKRLSLVATLTKDGKLLDEAVSQNILLSALDGIEKAVFQKAKIQTADKAAEALANEAELMGDFMLELSKEAQRQRRRTTTPVLPDDAIDLVLVPGETTQGEVAIPTTEIIPPKKTSN